MLYPNPQLYRELKCIFVHSCKCAGSSIEKRLKSFCPGMQKCGGHSTALGFQRGFPKEFAEYFKFAVAREPVDRFLSAFYYLQQMPVHPALNNESAHEAADADHFVRLLEKDASIAPRMVHLLPQSAFVCDEKGAVIIDKIYRFEALESAWQEICQRIGIPRSPLERLNRSRRPVETPSELVKAFVAREYAQDFDLFGYR